MESIKTKFRALIKDFLKSEQDEPVSKTKQLYADTIVRNPSGEILLLQRSYNDDFMAGKWCVPGGKIESGEAPLIAAKRELFEETGIDNNQILEYNPLTTIEKDDCVIHYFEAILEDNEPLMVLDNEEHFRYEFTSISKLDRYDLILDLGEVITNNLQSLLKPFKEQEVLKGCLMFFPDINQERWSNKIKELVPEDICKEYEFEPHITILYGFIDNELDKQKLKYLVSSFVELNPLDISLSKISLFENDEQDVVKIGVIDNNGNLTHLNKLVKDNFPYQSNYPDYKPHFTLAYVKSGEGKQYEGIKIDEDEFGISNINSGEIIYSDPEKNKMNIATVLEVNMMNEMELLPVELVYLEETQVNESLVKAEDIMNAFDEGKISDDDFLSYQAIGKAVSEITKGYDAGVVSESDFFAALERTNDFLFIKGEDGCYFLLDNNDLEEGLLKAEELGLLDPDATELEKGRKAMPVGAKAIWGGIHYLKTTTGWKPVGKKRGQVKENHDFIHENEEKDKDHLTMVHDAGKMESEAWVEKHGSNLHSKYKQVHDYLHRERIKREKKQQETKPEATAPQEETKPVETAPEPVKEEPKASEPEPQAEEPTGNSLGLNISMYSEKSILITGETYKNLELLRNLKKDVGAGTWNKSLNGWIFPASAKDKIMAAIGAKIDDSTAEGTKQKEAAIEMKNAVDPGTPVELPVTHPEPETKEETPEEKKEEPVAEEPKTEEAKVVEITTNEDGKVEYTVETEDGTKATVTEEEIAIPAATDEKAQELINNATEENRAKTTKMIFGKEAGDQSVSDQIEQEGLKDVKAEVKEFTTRSGKTVKALDYSFITPKDVQIFDQDDILNKPKPYWIPEIDEKSFEQRGFVFNYIKQNEGELIIELNKGNDFMTNYYSTGTKSRNHEADYAVVSFEQYVAIQDYYRKKKKAELEKENIDYLKWKAKGIKEWNDTSMNYFKPFEYDNLSKEQKKKYNKDQWEALSVDEKIDEVPHMKKLPFKGKSTRISTLKDNYYPRSYFQMYKDLVDSKDKGLNYGRGEAKSKSIVEYDELRETLGFKMNDLEVQKEENDNTYAKGQETSYGNSGLKDDLLDTHGVKIKTQNGKEMKPEQVNDIKSHLSKVYDSFGDRSSMAKQYGLKISHAGDTHMHASKASGIYFPHYKAIGVGHTYDSFGFTLAHEFAHFIDNYAGTKSGRHFASDDYNSLAGQIATTFRKNLNKKTDSKYMNRTCECFARAFEQYHAIKAEGHDAIRFGGAKYYHDDNQVNKEVFEGQIKPLIEQFLQENNHILKSAYNELNLIDLNNSFELIKASFDNDEISLNDFMKAANDFNEISKGDPSHNGKLVKKVIINKMGKKETTWVKRGDEGDNQDVKKNPSNEPVKHSKKVLSAFAAETPEKELKRVINEHTDEKLRAAAHAELDRREKKEKVQDKDKKESKPAPKKESTKKSKPEKKEEVSIKPKSFKQLEQENRSTFPKIPTKNIFLNDVVYPPHEEKVKADEYLTDDNEKDLPVQNVKISDIIPTQKVVTINNLKSAAGSKDKPVLLKLDGKYYVLDGHHRISNEILSGNDTIDAHVFSGK